MQIPGKQRCATAAVVGMFDGVHAGHRHLLASLRAMAASHALAPIVVTFPNHPLDEVAPDRAPMLLTSPEEKTLLLEHEGVEVCMIPFTSSLRHTSASGFLRMLRERWNVSRMLLGFNNRFGHDAPADFCEYMALGASEGIIVELATEWSLKGEARVSSSGIRQLLAEGKIERANALLGRPYDVAGIVVHGEAIGRSMGFPTANVVPDFPRKMVPANGVYAAKALVDGADRYPAMVNIGVRPTVSCTGEPTIEAHLVGFEGNLYGHRVMLEFHRFVRNERRFANLDELKAQLQTDLRNLLACP